MIRKLFVLLLLSVSSRTLSQEFEIRGVLPWHNFLSGPTAWNESDYEKYLDDCRENGINFIAFHNYTGGGERYFNYVEPMVKIVYKNVLPAAGFDHSGTSRWGYLPMKVSEFAFNTDTLFRLPPGEEYFGANCAVTARTDEERYERAQELMKKVLVMAHERNIEMAMGFEFGVAPPEYASIRTSGDMYWHGDGSLIYNPFDPDAAGILYATIDDILSAYKGIDWIYLWLNEHCMFGVDTKKALGNKYMKEFYLKNEHYFDSPGNDESLRFLGVWAQAYIMKAYDYIRKKAPGTKIVIGGWGSENQIAPLLNGLNRSLPGDIVFSMLNPAMGEKAHPRFFADLAKNRKIWAIPWLEGDAALWHLQPRVNLLSQNVKKASEDKLNGVVAIHWRTEEIKLNFETFCLFAQKPAELSDTEQIYRDFLRRDYGSHATDNLAPVMASIDISGTLKSIPSPVYYAYTPLWGRLNAEQSELCRTMISRIDDVLTKEFKTEYIANLKWLRGNYEFTLLLDSVGRSIEPAWRLRAELLSGTASSLPGKAEIEKASESLNMAPLENMFRVFASRVRSTGELGELSSLNQRVWREYLLLSDFLKELKNSEFIKTNLFKN